jgi:hypothetical protein
MENNGPESLNNNMIYDDNYIQNYEEMACCSNSIFTNFLQENGNYILNYISDLCFKNVSIDEEAQIVNDPNKKLETPLCSDNKKSSKDIITNNIDNQINNQNIRNNQNNQYIHNNNQNNQNNNHSLNNSLHSEVINPSNDSAAEPITAGRVYDNIENQNENNNNLNEKKENIITIIKNALKDFFSNNKKEEQNNDNISGSVFNLNVKNRPNLKRNAENDILALSQVNQNYYNQRNKNNNYNVIRHANSHIFQRPQLFSEEVLSNNISEENNDEALKLVSFIPVFTVRKKTKTKDGSNRCTICLTEFEIGDKKSTLPCMHSFHSKCIERWIKKKKYCPICKLKITLESLKKSLEQKYK